jgi:hypothetical protein
VDGNPQKDLILIHARELASKLATAMFITDAKGNSGRFVIHAADSRFVMRAVNACFPISKRAPVAEPVVV